MAVAPELEQAAKQAAEQVYIELVAMLLAGETGEVAVVVGFNQAQVESRPVKKRPGIKLQRGYRAIIERVR